MKYILGVIASNELHYSEMKKVWIMNVLSNYQVDTIVYFIYGDKDIKETKVDKIGNGLYDIYVECEEKYDNILLKTILFYEYIKDNYDKYIVLRTNISTLFEMALLKRYMQHIKEYKYFIGGTFIHGYMGIDTWISGTNLCITSELVKIILENKYKLLNIKKNDDVVISEFLMYNMDKDWVIWNNRRIDFVDDIIFQYCNVETSMNVFCYRFKSFNRWEDVKLMHKMYINEFDIFKIINETDKKLLHISTDKYHENIPIRLSDDDIITLREIRKNNKINYI